MTRLGPDPQHWLPELRNVLMAIATALGERSPSPLLVMALRSKYEHCIPGHTVQIEYFPDGYTDDPECLSEYAVSLSGDRLLSSWLLLERDLHQYLCGAASRG